MENKWSENTKRYLFGLALLEESYKMKKISRALKKQIEDELTKSFKDNYWKLNPNIKDPIFKEILKRMFYTYEITHNAEDVKS